MNLTSKGEYGLLAMFYLGQNYNSGPIQMKEIAAKEGISERYLEQLLSTLKSGGFVQSIRGVQGGYVLARSPKDISIGEIIRSLSLGCRCGCNDGVYNNKEGENIDRRIIKQLWHTGLNHFFSVLDNTSLEQLIEQKMEMEKIFIYHI